MHHIRPDLSAMPIFNDRTNPRVTAGNIHAHSLTNSENKDKELETHGLPVTMVTAQDSGDHFNKAVWTHNDRFKYLHEVYLIAYRLASHGKTDPVGLPTKSRLGWGGCVGVEYEGAGPLQL